MIQPFNLYLRGSKVTFAQDFNGNDLLSSVLFQGISTNGKGILHLFRYDVHFTLPKTIRGFQNFV